MTQHDRRIHALLQIRLDGAEPWDAVAFVREQERAGTDPWQPVDGQPMPEEAILEILAAADRQILEGTDWTDDQARKIALAQRRSLFARAVQGGDIRAALAVLADLAKLQGLYEKKVPKESKDVTWVVIAVPTAQFPQIAEELELLSCVDGLTMKIE